MSTEARLARIAEAHYKYVYPDGGTLGECNECSWYWPCPTWTWAATERDPLSTWDPYDDAEPVPADGGGSEERAA